MRYISLINHKETRTLTTSCLTHDKWYAGGRIIVQRGMIWAEVLNDFKSYQQITPIVDRETPVDLYVACVFFPWFNVGLPMASPEGVAVFGVPWPGLIMLKRLLAWGGFEVRVNYRLFDRGTSVQRRWIASNR